MTDFHNTITTASHAELGNDADLLGHPDDILENTRLTVSQKRAVLASWASDANVVPHLPALRQLPNGSIIMVEEILGALKALDRENDPEPGSNRNSLLWQRPFERRRAWAWRALARYRRGPDNDDDPPASPAYAPSPPRNGGGASYAVAEPVLA